MTDIHIVSQTIAALEATSQAIAMKSDNDEMVGHGVDTLSPAYFRLNRRRREMLNILRLLKGVEETANLYVQRYHGEPI